MQGLDREIASTLNDVISLHEAAVDEIARVSVAVGREGKVAERGVLVNAEGSWKELIDSTNNLIADTIRPTVETSRVIEAVVRGELLFSSVFFSLCFLTVVCRRFITNGIS